jgi:hypothetical protein
MRAINALMIGATVVANLSCATRRYSSVEVTSDEV